MISEIACKSKNSFAINNKKELYSWGSYETGILGTDELSDALVPTKVQIKAYGEEYLVDSISLGHFHIGAVCCLKDYFKLDCSFTSEGKNMIEEFKNWFFNSFIWEINEIKSFTQAFLRVDQFFTNLKFKKLKKKLLYSFINLMKLNNGEFFNMTTFYEQNLKIAMQLLGDDAEINVEKWDVLFPSDFKKSIKSKELKNVKDFLNFIKECQIHFINNKKDISYFIRLVTNFERDISKKRFFNLLKYPFVKGSKKLIVEKKIQIQGISDRIFD